MNKIIVIIVLSLFSMPYIHAQGVQNQQAAYKLDFEHDADGNLSSRKIATLSAKSKENNSSIDSTAVTDVMGKQKIILYPNPTRGILRLDIKLFDPNKKNTYSVYSLSGAKLCDGNILSSSAEIDLSQYPQGNYLLDLLLDGKVSRWKIIKL